MAARPVVAVFNSNTDTVEMLRDVFEAAGMVVVAGHIEHIIDGTLDYEAYTRQHQPNVIVYDVSLPYERNWRRFEHIRDMPASRGVPFVVTTTNARAVRQIAGPATELHEIVGKPYDLKELVRAVNDAIGRR